MARTFIVLFLTLQAGAFCFATVKPVSLKCENNKNPINIGIGHPHLSWQLESTDRNQIQTAYEIMVSDNHEDLLAGKSVQWETGKVFSRETINIAYGGEALRAFTRYYWRVRSYDKDGKPSEWSEPAFFETAMLRPADWTAGWIGDGKKQPPDEQRYAPERMPLFRRTFGAEKEIASAKLYIAGLGYYEAFINGKKVGDQVLDPGWTAYGKQVLYSVHDVTSLVRAGENVVAVMPGSGWWNPLPFKFFGRWDLRDYQQTGRPCVKAELHIVYADGRREKTITDASWTTAPGPVYRNNVYLGEHYDAGLEQRNWNVTGTVSRDWTNAVVVAGPSGELTPQMQPPIRITRVLKAQKIIRQSRDTFIVDFGQNFAGVVKLKVKGPKGTKITLRLGEGLFPNGKINLMTAVATQIKKGGIKGGPGAPETAWQEDSYTLKGEGTEVWAPRFTFHGFRYAEVTGWPGEPKLADFEGLRMNSDLPLHGSFSCSNEDFNRLHDVIQWTFLSNVFSVQSDCPGREKMGYGADMVVSANAFIYNYDMSNFYRKAVRDFINDQRPQGGITEIAPFTGIADRGYGDDSGPMGWQLGFPFLQKQLYDFYGDKRVIAESYPAFTKQIAFLQSRAVDGLFHWDISDHEAVDPKPEAFSASVFYYHHMLLAAEFAGILDKADDSVKFARAAGRIKRDIVRKYYVPGIGRFDNGTQSAQVLGLYYDLVEDDSAAFETLMSEFRRHRMHVSSGIFGVKMMFDVLRQRNRNDVAIDVAGQRTFPGWLYMLDQGATTLWESWEFPETSPSRNHPMFGSIDEWFYRSVLGINPLAAGFSHIQIKPQPAGDLTSAKGYYESVCGRITSEWVIANGKFVLQTTIPANTTAEIWVPTGARSFAVSREGIEPLRTEKGFAVYTVGSGDWSFTSDIGK